MSRTIPLRQHIIPRQEPDEMAQMLKGAFEIVEMLRNRSDFVNFVDAMLLDEGASMIEELAAALVQASSECEELSRRRLMG